MRQIRWFLQEWIGGILPTKDVSYLIFDPCNAEFNELTNPNSFSLASTSYAIAAINCCDVFSFRIWVAVPLPPWTILAAVSAVKLLTAFTKIGLDTSTVKAVACVIYCFSFCTRLFNPNFCKVLLRSQLLRQCSIDELVSHKAVFIAEDIKSLCNASQKYLFQNSQTYTWCCKGQTGLCGCS